MDQTGNGNNDPHDHCDDLCAESGAPAAFAYKNLQPKWLAHLLLCTLPMDYTAYHRLFCSFVYCL